MATSAACCKSSSAPRSRTILEPITRSRQSNGTIEEECKFTGKEMSPTFTLFNLMHSTDRSCMTIVFVSNDEMIIKVVISIMQFAPCKTREEGMHSSWRPHIECIFSLNLCTWGRESYDVPATNLHSNFTVVNLFPLNFKSRTSVYG